LKRYREQEAGWRGVPSFFVLTEKVISLIAEQRPTDLRQLRDIPGVGQATVEQHGNTIIAIVRGQWV
jgi:DNA helicase-2/ATP-dependent DNA helicase PcrA